MKIILPVLLILSLPSVAQKMKILSGDLEGLRNESTFHIKFTYDNIVIGQGLREKDYLDKVSARWEEREPGKGPLFVKQWYDDRSRLYEPAFIKSFEAQSRWKLQDSNAKYTLILKTQHLEGGWDVGVAESSAILGGELWIVETADNSKVKAIVSVVDSQGANSSGGDFNMTNRIKSAYAAAGKWLAIFMMKKSK